ncbi:MAG: GGDEF domain-containing protein [Proteobacteria bacterium]|nr:GGDEF domain-containing protein [Pseudomonadota bacterium]
MTDDNEQSVESVTRISNAQKMGMSVLITVFVVIMGMIVFGRQHINISVFAAAGTIVIAYLLSILYLITSNLLKKLNEAYAEINLISITDELTQLHNIKHFDALFENELSKAIRHNRDLSCFILDIDHFKTLIENYGQIFCDEVLLETADVIKDNSRSTDIVARYASDKFICLLPETDVESAIILSKRLRALVEGESFSYEEDNKTIHITISIGATSCKPGADKGIDIYNIIGSTNKALDLAKERGGNRVEYLVTSNTQASQSQS